MKVVIVGGVAGGATAAARLRRLDEQAEILILERGEFISFANCGLPYHIGGTIEKKEALLLQTPKSFHSRFNVTVRVLSEVTAINRTEKTITVKNLVTNEVYIESYDKLILAPGAEPANLAKQSDLVFTLRTIPDTLAIKSFIDDHQPKTAIIVGGGYIGLEMAENLLKRNIRVTVLIRGNRVLSKTLDYEMATLVHQHLRRKGMRICCHEAPKEVKEIDGKMHVITDHDTFVADFVIMAISVKPENQLAIGAGLTINDNGNIIVNDRMQTNDPDIFAVGDAVATKNILTERQMAVNLAGPANKQARIVADNICGIDSRYEGSLGSSIIGCCGIIAAGTGLTESALQTANIPYQKVYAAPANHATYYPNSSRITIKLLFAPEDGRILGAQLVGNEGVDKRCDVLATAIYGKMTVHDLTKLELCYAPPFSSPKDPVNMAGFIAENLMNGRLDCYYWDEVESLDPQKVTILDVTTPKEFKKFHIDGAINIPVDSLRKRINELDPSKPVYINCAIGLRGYIAHRILKDHGFQSKDLAGGADLWQMIDSDLGYQY